MKFQLNTRVTDLGLRHDSEGYTVMRIVCERGGQVDEITVVEKDYVIVTLGSMTEASSLGQWTRRPS